VAVKSAMVCIDGGVAEAVRHEARVDAGGAGGGDVDPRVANHQRVGRGDATARHQGHEAVRLGLAAERRVAADRGVHVRSEPERLEHPVGGVLWLVGQDRHVRGGVQPRQEVADAVIGVCRRDEAGVVGRQEAAERLVQVDVHPGAGQHARHQRPRPLPHHRHDVGNGQRRRPVAGQHRIGRVGQVLA
jgi:hypothetical protein